jgi:hypothetical protein
MMPGRGLMGLVTCAIKVASVLFTLACPSVTFITNGIQYHISIHHYPRLQLVHAILNTHAGGTFCIIATINRTTCYPLIKAKLSWITLTDQECIPSMIWAHEHPLTLERLEKLSSIALLWGDMTQIKTNFQF